MPDRCCGGGSRIGPEQELSLASCTILRRGDPCHGVEVSERRLPERGLGVGGFCFRGRNMTRSRGGSDERGRLGVCRRQRDGSDRTRQGGGEDRERRGDACVLDHIGIVRRRRQVRQGYTVDVAQVVGAVLALIAIGFALRSLSESSAL
jgi:hypothetical protein